MEYPNRERAKSALFPCRSLAFNTYNQERLLSVFYTIYTSYVNILSASLLVFFLLLLRSVPFFCGWSSRVVLPASFGLCISSSTLLMILVAERRYSCLHSSIFLRSTSLLHIAIICDILRSA